MSNFLRRLLLRCDQHEDVVITADETLDWDAGQLDWCLATGILVSTMPAVELACHDCAEQSVERIVYLSPEWGDCLLAYLPCPQCGPVRIGLERLRRWQVNLPQLWKALFASASIDLEVREVVPQRIWRIGKARWADATWDVVIGRQLWWPDAAEVTHRARFSARSVVFVPARPPQCEGHAFEQRTFVLRDVVAWNGSAAAGDFAQIESVLAATVPARPRLSRPTRKRAQRAALIEKLVKLVKEHIEAARDYARTTAERGMAELLPRPSQRDLARSAGTTEMAVSRCLRDSSARELRLLWEWAGDVDRLQGLPASGRPGR